MSKHRPPNANPAPSAAPVTADSSLTDILRAETQARQEIMRRRSWERLQALQAELADLPPVPETAAAFVDED